MTKTYCDVCGEEVKKAVYPPKLEGLGRVYDHDGHPIKDICPKCKSTLWTCLIMMARTGWRPDFHEKLESEHAYDRDRAGNILSVIEDQTGLKF